MKKIIVCIFVAVSLISCSGGLNKSIIEPLDVDVLKKQMKNDEDFSEFYKEIQEMRSWILSSDIRQAKYSDITYAQYRKFDKKVNDTTFTNKLSEKIHKEYDVLYPDYTKQVDSVMKYWNGYMKENSLDSLVKIEFSDLWKERYSYSGDVKDVNIGFAVTPLKGTIEQLIFRYCIKSKISNDGKMDIWNSHRCLSSSPISKTKTLYWEADYSDEKYLKNMTAETVKRDYDFLIEVVEVRIDGTNMSEKLALVPKYVKYALDDKALDGGYWKDSIIKETINPEYESFWDYAMPKMNDEYKKIDPVVFDLINDYQHSDDED